MANIKESEIFDIKKDSILSPKTAAKLEEASTLLGEINQISTNVFEYDFINEALKNIESLMSARIEGTTGNLEDLYLKDALEFERKRQLKLFSAINVRHTINSLEKIVAVHKELDKPLIRQLHKMLSENDPFTAGIPGKFREKPVKIRNSKLGDFFPPEHFEIEKLIDRFVSEIKKDTHPYLIRAALAHYWFESIHPFEDGNGRSGRLLITTLLLQKGLLKSPILNVSQYFDAYRDDYIQALRDVTVRQDYADWVNFFLDAVVDQCNHNKHLMNTLRELKDKNLETIRTNTKGTPVPGHVLDFALNNMFLTVPQVASYLGRLRLPLKDKTQAARTNIKRLVEFKILEEMGKIGKEKLYVHTELKKIVVLGKK